MAIGADLTTIGAINNSAPTTPASTNTNSSAAAAKKPQSLGKDEFLKLLIAQLKNQDPLKPNDGTEFVAQLAQFSSLEKLISIDENIGASKDANSGGGIASLASYLGTEVTLNSNQVTVENGDAGSVKFNLPNGAAAGKLEFSGADGQVVQTVDLGSLPKGLQQIDLTNVGLANGDYAVAFKGIGQSGSSLSVPVNVAGVVTGFAPGEPPLFFIGSRQFQFSEIQKVEVPRLG